MQFVWHAQLRQAKDMPVKYVSVGIYWQVCLPQSYLFLLPKHTLLPSSGHGHTGQGFVCCRLPHSTAWPVLARTLALCANFRKMRAWPLFSSPFFVITWRHKCSRNQLPYQSDIYTESLLKGLLLPCYLIGTGWLHAWPTPSYIILQHSKASPLDVLIEAEHQHFCLTQGKSQRELNHEGSSQADTCPPWTYPQTRQPHDTRRVLNEPAWIRTFISVSQGVNPIFKSLNKHHIKWRYFSKNLQENVISQFMPRWNSLPFYSDLQNRLCGESNRI